MSNQRIYLSLADVGELEEEYVLRALRSGWVAPLGPEVDQFEAEVCERVGVAHAVALSSGTAALHLALLALGVGKGDVVITSTFTFAATANAIVYTGAEPYFVDSDPVTGNIDPELVAEALAELTARGERVAAVVPVDLLGKSADYTALGTIAAQYEVPIVADAAESLGASHGGKAAGSFGVAAALSFNGNKIMTTSGGGMLLSNDEALASKARYLSTQARQPVLHYEHEDIGYNYRLSNILAALGRAQLSRLDEILDKKRAHRNRYREFFAEVPEVTIFGGENDEEDNFWLTAIEVAKDSHLKPAELMGLMAEREIEARPLWKPMHLQPVFTDARGKITGTSERLFNQGVTLPSGVGLTADQFARIEQALTTWLKN